MARKSAVSRYLAEIGKKGGQKKVPKGIAALSPAERTELAKKAAAKRWAKKAGGRGRKKEQK